MSSSAASLFIFWHRYFKLPFVVEIFAIFPKKGPQYAVQLRDTDVVLLELLDQILGMYVQMMVGWPLLILPIRLCHFMVVLINMLSNDSPMVTRSCQLQFSLTL
jgi:hypothetical protein